MTTASYHVIGMSCEHCVRAVSTELHRLPGVEAVDVDLATGEVTVASDAPLERAAVVAAIDEAGYEVAP